MRVNPLASLFLAWLSAVVAAGAQEHYQSAEPAREALQVEALTMLPLERERLANQLTAYVVNVLVPSQDRDKHRWSRRLLGVALTLHPQNPRARLTNQRLVRGMTPAPIAMDWDASLLAKFLYNRGQQLLKETRQEQRENALAARYLTAIAAQVDPYFEDAVYAHEVNRLDGVAPDWDLITGDVSPASTPTEPATRK